MTPESRFAELHLELPPAPQPVAVEEIDLLAEVAGLGAWEEVKAGAILVDAFDRKIAILDLSSLIKAKRAAGREKDLAALPELESLLAWIACIADARGCTGDQDGRS